MPPNRSITQFMIASSAIAFQAAFASPTYQNIGPERLIGKFETQQKCVVNLARRYSEISKKDHYQPSDRKEATLNDSIQITSGIVQHDLNLSMFRVLYWRNVASRGEDGRFSGNSYVQNQNWICRKKKLFFSERSNTAEFDEKPEQ